MKSIFKQWLPSPLEKDRGWGHF